MNPEEIRIAIQSLETEELMLRFKGNTLTSDARLVYIEELKNRGVKVVGLEIDENATKEVQRTDQTAEKPSIPQKSDIYIKKTKNTVLETLLIIFQIVISGYLMLFALMVLVTSDVLFDAQSIGFSLFFISIFFTAPAFLLYKIRKYRIDKFGHRNEGYPPPYRYSWNSPKNREL